MNQQKKSAFTSLQLEKLSTAELIKIILQQHIELRRLEAELLRQRAQSHHLASSQVEGHRHDLLRCPIDYLLNKSRVEKWRSADGKHNLFMPPCAEVMADLGLQQELKQLTQLMTDRQHKLEKATRQALRRLEDVGYLGHSALLTILGEIHQVQLDGWEVEKMLQQAIEDIAPTEDDPNYDQWQLRYRLLQLTYREKAPIAEIINLLALSERQYYRELRAAIQTVAAHLVEVNE